MKKYLISAMFLLIGSVLNAQEEEITMVVSKYSNNTIEQTGFIDQDGKKDSTWIHVTNGIVLARSDRTRIKYSIQFSRK